MSWTRSAAGWGKEIYNLESEKLLSNWIVRPKANKVDVIPLKNAVKPATATRI
jgi:hypothetical protein